MDVAYWNTLAETFERDVFDVVGNDLERVVLAALDEHANPRGSACDLGCGVGRHIPLLAERFGTVLGSDISRDCLGVARGRFAHLPNVRFRQADLAAPGLRLGSFDLALCLNVAIMPDARVRRAVLTTVLRSVRTGGCVLLVVPSLESRLLVDARLIEWNLREGSSPAEAAAESRRDLQRPGVSLAEGVLPAGQTPTKHYLREELDALLPALGQEVLAIRKVCYSWKTEFASPPRWMGPPRPWDWLAVVRKGRGPAGPRKGNIA